MTEREKRTHRSLITVFIIFGLALVWFGFGCYYEHVHGPGSITNKAENAWMEYVMGGLLILTVIEFFFFVYYAMTE